MYELDIYQCKEIMEYAIMGVAGTITAISLYTAIKFDPAKIREQQENLEKKVQHE